MARAPGCGSIPHVVAVPVVAGRLAARAGIPLPFPRPRSPWQIVPTSTALSNRPTHFTDRPETISGLSEWPYAVPFMYRLLMSGDPQLCASLISDGLEDEEPDQRTRLPAISSTFEPGLARVKRFAEIVRTALATPAAAPAAAPATPAPATPEPASLLGKLKRLFSSDDAAPAGAAKPAARGRGPIVRDAAAGSAGRNPGLSRSAPQ